MFTRLQKANFCSATLKILHDPEKSQFKVFLNNKKAFLQYSQNDDTMNFEHTLVPEVFQGKGVGKKLVEVYNFDNIFQNCIYLLD